MYFKLAVLPVFLYALALAGKFEGLGLRFAPTLKGAGSVALNTTLAAVIILPLALITGFVAFNWSACVGYRSSPAASRRCELKSVYVTQPKKRPPAMAPRPGSASAASCSITWAGGRPVSGKAASKRCSICA